MNKIFGETQDPTEVRNDYFVIEPRQKRVNFLDNDEMVYMEQFNAKANTKQKGISAKQQLATEKLAKDWM